MRLRLFDRIRRLVHPRRSEATGTVLQGRHRRDQRPAPGSGPAARATKYVAVVRPVDGGLSLARVPARGVWGWNRAGG